MRYLLLLCFLISSSISLIAQTSETEQKLAQTVRIYNEMRAYSDTLKAENFQNDYIVKLYDFSNQAKPLINFVNTYGTQDEKATVRYFNMCIQYEIAFVHGMGGQNSLAYPIMNAIKSDVDYFSYESSFPLRYKFDDKNYVVKYENFVGTSAEYYTGFAEICANLGKIEESIYWGKKSIASSNSTLWFKYIAYNKLIEAKKKLNQIDAEYIEFIVANGLTYYQLDTASISTVQRYNYPSPLSMTNKLIAALDSIPSLVLNCDQLALYARTIKKNHVYAAADVYTRILKLNQSSLNNLDEALSFYKEQYYSSNNVYLFSNSGNTHQYVYAGCMRMQQLLNASSPCYYWNNLGDYFIVVNEPKLSMDALEKAIDCQQEIDKQVKRANRKANNDFGLCLSAYPIPMIWGNFGGSVEFNFEKVALTVAATKIGHDKDYQNDFYNPIQADKTYSDYYGNELDRETLYYNGSRINTSLKFFMNEQSDSRGYFSLNLGRVMKTYDPILTSIYDTVTAAPVYYGNIVAKEKKYTFFVGFGAQGKLSDRWMIDAGLGIGVSLPTLTVDSPYFSDRYYFNSYLVQSSQDNKIGMSGYMNVSIGYYLFKP
ncbi:MAG: hypothetical protein RI922_526 [Bacteroidota bacterium]|jgi:hypothetical protein